MIPIALCWELNRLREFNHLLALLQRDIRLLPVRPVTAIPPLPAQLAVEIGRPDTRDLHFEELLDRILNLLLGSVPQDPEGQGAQVFFHESALLRDYGSSQYFMSAIHRPN